jgi:hypothetical protein
MLRCVAVISWSTVNGIVFSMLSRAEITDWLLFAGAVGASMFSWGMGSYHQWRVQQRKEAHEDRVAMIEDVRAHTRILVEMESRQVTLQKQLDALTLHVEKVRCNFPDATGKPQCGANHDEIPA